MKNLITIDLEDYYQVSGLADVVPFSSWTRRESRIAANTERVLECLGEIKATFFVLGWEAEKRPEIIRTIASAGHEIATHGMQHDLITSMNRQSFKQDLDISIKLLQDITGQDILGFRAPSFSITPDTEWAYEVMIQSGLKYDSSVFPVKRSRGGVAGSEKAPFKIETEAGTLVEFPLAVSDFLGREIPVAGGGFFRFYPYFFTRNAIKQINDSGRPVVVYLHPWELDPDQPRLKSTFSSDGFKHYYGLKSTAKKFNKLLKDFEFSTLKDYLYNYF